MRGLGCLNAVWPQGLLCLAAMHSLSCCCFPCFYCHSSGGTRSSASLYTTPLKDGSPAREVEKIRILYSIFILFQRFRDILQNRNRAAGIWESWTETHTQRSSWPHEGSESSIIPADPASEFESSAADYPIGQLLVR